MGYPMRWQRLVRRNHLTGNYDDAALYVQDGERDAVHDAQCRIAGDMRRLERNTRDPRHLDAYARKAGVTTEQVRIIFDAFFGTEPLGLDHNIYPPNDHTSYEEWLTWPGRQAARGREVGSDG